MRILLFFTTLIPAVVFAGRYDEYIRDGYNAASFNWSLLSLMFVIGWIGSFILLSYFYWKQRSKEQKEIMLGIFLYCFFGLPAGIAVASLISKPPTRW